MKKHFKIFNKDAFTLIEMLLVLLIISLLLILIIPNIAKQSKHIQATGCEAQLKMIDSQIEAYTLKFNKKPTSVEDLVTEGYIKENQKQCKSGAMITISNGEAIAN
ncbi:prepilin-type N-terminal cleavage/methylation domain-containing protein [Staphylococcus succinus]|uniref:ComG operon protein 3 n=1 Tax=Staphylococcus succinus TaxID=61015 RepID=A0A9Q6HQA9_9STAP|nr:competence type IV pilus major pilin ComGC [Staphylococcus succinus]MEB7461378.1 prepilin-type N-terminal cleavage/methylation domain-containing protein [Staphylococcus succinus]MEB8126656.1 prepilin-type N-terminal cleavage/methylation domain-containing protein [Staphylococcus succinus]MEB8209283.1 prepilin-type N-terminal cleavage/methylation domain-containing protein [Staphylococcus succinus]PKI23291.1 competence protein ComGC [Staphylococcus succinus]PTI36645.1 prepilin-type N-terminal 